MEESDTGKLYPQQQTSGTSCIVATFLNESMHASLRSFVDNQSPDWISEINDRLSAFLTCTFLECGSARNDLDWTQPPIIPGNQKILATSCSPVLMTAHSLHTLLGFSSQRSCAVLGTGWPTAQTLEHGGGETY